MHWKRKTGFNTTLVKVLFAKQKAEYCGLSSFNTTLVKVLCNGN